MTFRTALALLLLAAITGLVAPRAEAKVVPILPGWTVLVTDGAGHPAAGIAVEEDWEFLGLADPHAGTADLVTDAHGLAVFPARSFTEPEADLEASRTAPPQNVHGSSGPRGSVYVRTPGHKVGSGTFTAKGISDQPGTTTTRGPGDLRTTVTLTPLDIFDFIASRDWATARTLLATQPALAASRSVAGETPLVALTHDASLTPETPLLTDLVRLAPGINVQSRDGRTALHNAAKNHNGAVLDFLLSQGADPNLRIHDSASYTEDGYTALHFLFVASGNHLPDPTVDDRLAAIDALLGHGADINARDALGETPLQLAKEWGDPELVQALLERGAKPAPKSAASEN